VEATGPDPRRLSRAALVGGAVLILALLPRVANWKTAFAGPVAQIPPLDDLYHAKRILSSAAHPFSVLDFDPDRGVSGAFCPWPPLYDLAAGTAARALGGATPAQILFRASLFPPLVASVFLAALAVWLASRVGALAGLLAGVAAAISPDAIDKSRLAAIDHHFLEFPLAIGILAATAGLLRAGSRAGSVGRGAALGLAIAAALLVQPALVLGAGVAFLVTLGFDRRLLFPRAAAAVGFGFAALTLFAYRWSRPPGYPDDQWHLGLPHAALLLGAAAGSAADAWMLRRGAARALSAGVSLALAAFAASGVPRTLPALLEGSRFFGGDPWLDTIQEFRPLFASSGGLFWGDFCLLGGGAILVLAMPWSPRWRSGARGVALAFAAAYLLAALTTARFLSVAAPLFAVTGAVFVSDLRVEGRRGLAALAAALLLAPSLPLFAGRIWDPPPAVPEGGAPVVRAARALRDPALAPGRILPPWSWGHLFGVAGRRGVLVDNFGASIGRVAFDDACGILLAPREKAVAQFCRRTGARYIVLQNPLGYGSAYPRMLGLPVRAFLRDGRPTPLMRSSFWWRAYFAPPGGDPFPSFRRIVGEPEAPVSEGESAVQVWEFRG
jgi:hypothetical protein